MCYSKNIYLLLKGPLCNRFLSDLNHYFTKGDILTFYNPVPAWIWFNLRSPCRITVTIITGEGNEHLLTTHYVKYWDRKLHVIIFVPHNFKGK